MKFQLDGVVLLDSSFRHVVDPFGGQKPTQASKDAKVEMEVELSGAQEENHYVVKLRVRLESPDPSPNARYSVAVTHAVLLRVHLDEGEESPENVTDRVLMTGANIAFPYTREVISSLTSRGRFGPVWLNPQNFSTLFKQREEANADASARTTE